MTLVMVVFWGSLTIWSVQSAQVTCPHACQNTKEVAGVQGWNGEAFPSILYQTVHLQIAGDQPHEHNVRHALLLDYGTCTAVVYHHSIVVTQSKLSLQLQQELWAVVLETRVLKQHWPSLS